MIQAGKSVLNCEQQINVLFESCDSWAHARIEVLAGHGARLSEGDFEGIIDKVDEELNHFIEQCIARYGEGFPFDILCDLYRMMFEMEIKKAGIDNTEQIHRIKANAQIALSVVEGTMDPESALLVMRINQEHLQQRGGHSQVPCEDCVCGRK